VTVETFSKRPPPAPPVTPIAGAQARRIGFWVLLVGCSSAALVYFLRTWYATPSPEDLLANYHEANARQMGLLYGHSGVVMWEGLQTLAQPGAQAIVILVVTALVSLICFRVGWVDDDRAKGP
jgi:hypothetical protein